MSQMSLSTLQSWSWSAPEAASALAALRRNLSFPTSAADSNDVHSSGSDSQRRTNQSWSDSVVRALAADAPLGRRLEVESVRVSLQDIESFLLNAAPALLRLPVPQREGEKREGEVEKVLLLLGSSKRKVVLLSPDEGKKVLPVRELAEALKLAMAPSASERARAWVAGESDSFASLPSLPSFGTRRKKRAEEWLRKSWSSPSTALQGWLLRPEVGALVGREERGGLGSAISLRALSFAVWLPAWALLAWISFGDRASSGWWSAWVLLCLLTIPLGAGADLVARRLATNWSERVHRRLMSSLLRSPSGEFRHAGVAHAMGIGLEITQMQSFAQSGVWSLLAGMVQLVVVLGVLMMVAGPLALISFVAVMAVFFYFYHTYWKRVSAWTTSRLSLSAADIERLLGHRTRILQQRESEWHEVEDGELERYLEDTRQMENLEVVLSYVIPRAALVSLLIPVLLAAGSLSWAALPASLLGGVLAAQGLKLLAEGAIEGTKVWASARELRKILSRVELEADERERGDSNITDDLPLRPERAVLDIRGVRFRYREDGEPLLKDVSLRVMSGGRYRLEGESGGGKTTLARILSASLDSNSGELRLRGVDLDTWGSAEWRRRVVYVPQFHDNHILLGPLAYNLLIGRKWPPNVQDMRDAEEVCRALGLGPLLDRMPAGMMQLVGETGWQLSHGEKSRIFLARALLQNPDVLILDETLAALDPESVRLGAAVLRESDAAVLMIAHP